MNNLDNSEILICPEWIIIAEQHGPVHFVKNATIEVDINGESVSLENLINLWKENQYARPDYDHS